MPTKTAVPTTRLRTVLVANAGFSFLGGVIALLGGGWLSDKLGIDHVLTTRLLGAALMVFAVGVFFVSRRPQADMLSEAVLVSVADLTWVVATVGVLATGILTTAGVVVVAVLGIAVGDFGLSQLWFRSKALG